MRLIRFSAFVLLAFATSSFPASAQPSSDLYLSGADDDPQEIAQALKNCSDGTAKQYEINICALNDFRKADAEYRAAASATKRALAADPDMQLALDTASDAFKKFRDATCNFDRAGIGQGTMAPAVEFSCLAFYTERRAKALARYAACQKTDDCELPNLLYSYEDAAPDAKK